MADDLAPNPPISPSFSHEEITNQQQASDTQSNRHPSVQTTSPSLPHSTKQIHTPQGSSISQLLSNKVSKSSSGSDVRGQIQRSAAAYDPFVPRLCLNWFCQHPQPQTSPHVFPIPGAALFMDVSGFTAMTEALDRKLHYGEGAEQVRNVLSSYLSALLEIVDQFQGDVIKFAGNALLVVFYDDTSKWRVEPEAVQQRALKCAIACGLAATKVQFESGNISLKLKCAIGVGTLYGLHLGSAQRWEFLVAGDPLVQIAQVEHFTPIGNVVLSPHAAQLAKNFISSQPVTKSSSVPEQHSQKAASSSGSNIRSHSSEMIISGIVIVNEMRCDAPIPAPLPIPNPIPSEVHQCLVGYVPESARLALAGGIDPQLVADVREVSILFCSLIDIDTSSEKCITPMQQALVIAEETLHQYRGSLRQFLQEDKGVTLIGCFGLPMLSSDEDAVKCLKAAVKMQTQFKKHNLKSFIGITTGRVFCGLIGSAQRTEYAVIGPAVNLSARLMVAASNLIKSDDKSNQILVDERTQLLTSSRFHFSTLTPIHVKGKTEAVPIFQPLDQTTPEEEKPKVNRLIGRSKELSVVKEKLQEALVQSKGGVVLLEGPPGSGKSTILTEALLEVESSAPSTTTAESQSKKPIVIRSECREMDRTNAYLLVGHLLDRVLSVHCAQTTADKLQEEVASRVKNLRPELVPLLSIANSVLSLGFTETAEAAVLDGSLKRDKIVQILSTLIHSFATTKPIVLLVENFNFIDTSSFDVLKHLITTVPNGLDGFLMLVSYSKVPNVTDEYTALKKIQSCTSISVDRMENDELEQLVKETLKISQPLPLELKQFIVEKSLGSASYAIALTQSMVQQNLIRVIADEKDHKNSRCEFHPPAGHYVPERFEKLITSKIDQLHPVHSLILRVCSCVATRISLEMLADIVPLNITQRELIGEMAELEKTDFIFCSKRDSNGHPIEYEFRQNIVLEVAYSGLAFGTRQAIHLATADWYVRNLSEKDAHLRFGQIAYHFQFGKSLSKAVEFYRKAGDAALEMSSTQEALANFRSAIKILESDSSAAPKSVYCYFHRIIAESLWNLGGQSASGDLMMTHLMKAVEVAGSPFPSVEEIKRQIKQQKLEALLFLFERKHFLGSVADEEKRQLHTELCRTYLRFFRHLMTKNALDPQGYQAFYLWHKTLRLAEAARTKDLCWLYVFTAAHRRLYSSFSWSPLWRKTMLKRYGEFALAEAATLGEPVVSYINGMYSFLFKEPADLHLAAEYFQNSINIMAKMNPSEAKEMTRIDSQISLEESLSLCGAVQLLIWPAKALETGKWLLSAPRSQFIRIYEEIGHRIGAEALIRMGKTDEAWELMQKAAAKKLPDIADRLRFSHFYRCGVVHLRRGDFVSLEKCLVDASKLITAVPTVWFFLSYISAFAMLLFSYCDLRNEARDVEKNPNSPWRTHTCALQQPPSIPVPVSSFQLSDSAIEEMCSVVLRWLWDFNISLPCCVPLLWGIQGWYLHLVGQQEKAPTAWNRALRLAGQVKSDCFASQVHYIMGKHAMTLSAQDRNEHLRQAQVYFEKYSFLYDLKVAQQLWPTPTTTANKLIG